MIEQAPHADDGSASLEFITAALILLVPTVYLILTLSAIQAASLASEGAAREGARVFVHAPDRESAVRESTAAVHTTLADYGIESTEATVRVSCAPEPSLCLQRNSRVTVTVRVDVALPLAPAVIGTDTPLAVPVTSSSTHTVSRFWNEE